MNTVPIKNSCPKCGSPLADDAPRGLCPKCLLAAVSAPTEAGQLDEAHSSPPSLEAVAAAFPQLEIVELIGRGGMGVVYKARQPKLDRFVALKLLPHAFAADPAFAERFNREARLLARLNHPNIVTVYDFGQSGGFFFLLMEFVDGVNLRQAMQASRFTPQQALALVPRVCEALQFAHDEGILHRDIKPENILLDSKGRVKIADFGIAKLVGDRGTDVALTASGAAVGTPHYMAPEQLERPQDVDQRADIYSLGVVFYEMLTGELPIGRFAPPSEKSAVDPRVDAVVFRALEKEREKRYRSAQEVKTRVEDIRSTPPPPISPTTPAADAPQIRQPDFRPSMRLAVKLAAWTGVLVGAFAVVMPMIWKNWWPTIYREHYEVGLRPQSGAYQKVTVRAERRLYCWGQNDDRPFFKTAWKGTAALTLPGTDTLATLELDSGLERWSWIAPNSLTTTSREEPRPQSAADWMKSAGIDISHPAVLEEAAELIRLVKEAANGEVPGRAGLRQRKTIVDNKVGPFIASGGDGWGFTWEGAAFVDHRLVIVAAFLAMWFPGVMVLVRRHREHLAAVTPEKLAALAPAHEAAAKEVKAVATALFIVGVLNCLPIVLIALSYLAALFIKPSSPGGIVVPGVLATSFLIPSICGLMSGPLIMVAAQMLRRMVSREFAVVACIMATIPPLSPAFLIGIPIAVWGLKVLRRPDVKAAFDSSGAERTGQRHPLPPDVGTTPKYREHRVPPVGPHGTMVMDHPDSSATGGGAGDGVTAVPLRLASRKAAARWSGKAIAGAVLVGLTLGLGIPIGLALAVWMPVMPLQRPSEQFTLVVVALGLGVPGLVGTLLGAAALREVREGGTGGRRGAVVAVFAALGWPLALIDAVIGRLLGWMLFGLAMRVGVPLGLMPASDLAVAIVLTLLALGVVDWLAISGVWRWIKRSPALPSRSRLIRISCATTVGCLAAVGALFGSWGQVGPHSGEKLSSHFALMPDPAYGSQSESHKTSLRWTLAVAPSQQVRVSLNILSNNVEVLSVPLTASLRTSSAKHVQGEFTVDIVEGEAKQADHPQWRARLDAGSVGTAVFEFTPPVPVAIRWSPVEKTYPILLGRNGSFDGAVLMGVQSVDRGGRVRPSNWSARLHVEVRPSNLPLSELEAELIQGQVFRLPFILTAGQVATFTLVRTDKTGQTNFPMLSAYAMAPAGQTFSGEVRWLATGYGSSPSPRQTWTTILDTEGGRATSGGLNAPGDWQPEEPLAEPELVLLPESSTTVKLAVERGQPAASAARLNVQIVTQPHHLPANVIKRGGGGTGTNWLQAAERLNQFLK